MEYDLNQASLFIPRRSAHSTHRADTPGLTAFERIITAAGAPGFARGSASAVLARGYKPRASGEPKARPWTEFRVRRVRRC